METPLCENCRHILSTKWKRFSFIANRDPVARAGWRRGLGRFGNWNPTLVYRGSLKALETSQSECPLCEIFVIQRDNVGQEGRYANPAFSKSNGITGDGVWDAVARFQPPWRDDDTFKLRLEYRASTSEIFQVQIGTTPTVSFWVKLFADHGECCMWLSLWPVVPF